MSNINNKDLEIEGGMTEDELVSLIRHNKNKSINEDTEYLDINEKILKEYNSEPYGDEVDGQSQVVTNDVSDVVESDITALVRTFLSSDNIVEFVPNSSDPQEIQEAEEKSEYVNNVVKNQEDAFETLHGWMKAALIQKCSAIKYYVEEVQTPEQYTYSNVTEDELIEINDELEGENVVEIEIVSKTESEKQKISEEIRSEMIDFIIFNARQAGQQVNPEDITEDQIEDIVNQIEEGGRQIRESVFDVTFKVIEQVRRIRICLIPTEDFIISKDARNKNEAELVGDRLVKTRSSLIAEGYDRKLVEKLKPLNTRESQYKSQMDNIRNRASYGSSNIDDNNGYSSNKASEEVELYDLYMKVDFDGDGIAERRHILMSGDTILVNEIFNHVPYAILSSILMPSEIVGRSRAELARTTQRVKSVTTRQMLDNLYMSNNSRIAANENVDLDDLLDVRPNGVVRVEGDNPINNDIIPIGTQFTGDKSLLILQHLDNSRANSTGNFIANQGLDKDAVSKETATRFEGVKESGAAKIELVARVYAETGFKQLFEGICWLASRYEDNETELKVFSVPTKITPTNWRYKNQKTQPKIVNEEKMLSNLQALYGIQTQLLAQGSPLVDQSKIQNTLSMMVKGLGMYDVSKFFNNVNVPQEMLMAQVEQLTNQLQQAQAFIKQNENPLKDAEEIKAQATLISAQSKQNTEAIKLEEQKRQFDLEMRRKEQELALKQEEFMRKMAQQQEEADDKLATKLTELELKYGKNIDGSIV